jgi:hypothetical protein
MKSKIYAIISVIALTLTVTLISNEIKASSSEPGSIQDPLITKSYVDQEFEKIRQELGQGNIGNTNNSNTSNIDKDALIQSVSQYVDSRISDLENNLKSQTGQQGEVVAASFQVLELAPRQILMAGEGTEIIIRSGKVLAIGNNAGNGLSNITTGKDMLTGEEIQLNHLLIVPRADGRGIISQTESWIMVKGKYTIE